MKKEYIKWLAKKIRTSILAKTIVIAIFCSLVYLINKYVNFEPDTIMLFNFACLAFEGVTIYQSIKEHHMHEMQLITIVAIAFILNDFLDSEVFLSTFHIKLETFLIIIGICFILRISVPLLVSRISKIVEIFTEEWISNPPKQPRKDKRKQKNKANEKDSLNIISDEINLKNDNIKKQDIEITEMLIPLSEDKNYKTDKSNRLTKIGNTISLGIKKIIFIVILLLPIVFLIMVNIVCK